jgi:hypothetical protein
MFVLLISLTLLFSHLNGATITVSTDSTADYLFIQNAIDSAVNDDTVLVFPGTYVENLDYGGKNIVVCSHYIFDEDPALMYNTIIDGNQSGSVVKFDNGETRQAVLNGFTITNGSGTPYHASSPGRKLSGGGIFIRDSSPSILNCFITKNNTLGVSHDYGGGIAIAENTFPFLSNLIVTQNVCGYSIGGISIFSLANVEFDSVNRCSVYLNYGARTNDIGHGGLEPDYTIDIFIDTATIAEPMDYFIHTTPGDFLDVMNGKIEQVNSDLYVNPSTGNNMNAGSTVNEPLKNIHYSLALIHADAQNPKTIHLSAGTFGRIANGEYYPLNLRSYVSIKGAGKYSTILDNEYSMNPVLVARSFEHERDYTVSDFQIINGIKTGEYDMESLFPIELNTNLLIENILFTQNSMSKCISNPYLAIGIYPDSTSVVVRHCDFINNILGSAGAYSHQYYTYENCRFSYGQPYYFENGSSGANALSVSGHSLDASPYQYRNIKNCVFDNYIHNTTGWPGPHYIIGVRDAYETNFINCTFADNQVLNQYGAAFMINGNWESVRLVNCLFWENEPQQIYVDGGGSGAKEVVFSHCLVQDSLNGISGTGNYNLNWSSGNLSVDPQFSLLDSLPYSLSEFSPAIDAGTAFFVWEGDTIINLSPGDYVGSAPDIGAYEFGSGMKIIQQNDLPKTVSIGSAFPNPFNSSITIQYSLPHNEKVSIQLFDIQGRFVKEILNARINAGEHSFTLNNLTLSSGTYFIRIESKNNYDSKKIIFLK